MRFATHEDENRAVSKKPQVLDFIKKNPGVGTSRLIVTLADSGSVRDRGDIYAAIELLEDEGKIRDCSNSGYVDGPWMATYK